MLRGNAHEGRVLGIATDHAIQGNDIRCQRDRRRSTEVRIGKGRLLFMAAPLCLGSSTSEVGLRGSNLCGMDKSVHQQKVLDNSYPPADVKKSRCRRERALLHAGKQLPGDSIRSATVKPPQVALSDTVVELPVGGATVAGHGSGPVD